MSDFENPWKMARVLAARNPRPCPSTVRMHVCAEFGYSPSRADIERIMRRRDEELARLPNRGKYNSWGSTREPSICDEKYEAKMAKASAKLAQAIQEARSGAT